MTGLTRAFGAVVLLGGLIAASQCMGEEEFSLPASSALDVDKNGEVDKRESRKFAEKLVEARIKKVLEAGGEELTLPEVDKCVRLAGWLSARAKALGAQLKRFSLLDVNGDRHLSGKEYDAARELARLMSYCGRKVDRTGDGVIDRFEFLAARGTRAPRLKPKRHKGETTPIVEPPKPIKPYDVDGNMSLSFGETTKLAVTCVARKLAMERHAAEFLGIARRLELARKAAEVELARLVKEKKRQKRAEEMERLKDIGGAAQ